MEQYDYNEEKKLGGGIIAVAVILLVFSAFSLLGNLLLLVKRDTYKSLYKNMHLELPSTGVTTLSLIIIIALIATLILILCKKAIGVYSYFTVVAINFIANIVIGGFSLLYLVNLILPAILLILIMKKKEVFGLASSEN